MSSYQVKPHRRPFGRVDGQSLGNTRRVQDRTTLAAPIGGLAMNIQRDMRHDVTRVSLPTSALPRMTSMASADRTCFTETRQSNAHVNVTVPEGPGGDAARENDAATPQALPNRAPKRARFDDLDPATKTIFAEMHRKVRACLTARAHADSRNREHSLKIALAHPLTFPEAPQRSRPVSPYVSGAAASPSLSELTSAAPKATPNLVPTPILATSTTADMASGPARSGESSIKDLAPITI